MKMGPYTLARTGLIGVAIGVITLLLLGSAALPSNAGSLKELEDSVREFTLENGLCFLIIAYHDAPVFFYALCVDAGGVCEKAVPTGIAHLFEHTAFMGTTTVGSTDDT